jgi:AcrR family transcriptional regulator
LDQALKLFWHQGYEGASVADLTEKMGITAPSLYAAFGSKEQLYGESLLRYGELQGGKIRSALAKETTAYGAVRRLLQVIAENFTGKDTPPGCMLSATLLNVAPENRVAAKKVAQRRAAAIDRLTQLFEGGIKSGELPAGTDPGSLARFYEAIVQGMSVQAVDGASRAQLEAIGAIALKAWPGRQPQAP